MAINLQNMSTEEKLMTMEFLWDDLCKNQINFASPSWHATVLRDRENALAEGKDKFVEWEETKKEILNSACSMRCKLMEVGSIRLSTGGTR